MSALLVSLALVFLVSVAMEGSAWARAGGGSSSGSRGSRSFSAPSTPAPRQTPSPSQGIRPNTGRPGYSAPGAGTTRSPFWSGIAGGLAGGFLGSMLFGGFGHASPYGGGFGGSGISLFEIVVIGALIYFGMKWFRRRRTEQAAYYEDVSASQQQPYYGAQQAAYAPPEVDEVERGLDEIRRYDPSFDLEAFKENVEDMFFRIQAAWMNRSLSGAENLLSPEMTAYFLSEFSRMKQEGRINRLENIAVRKVEPSEAWQESGQDYITVLFTANLLDYTVDEQTGAVVAGDKLNPVKFQEFWTFCRDVGGRQWQLSGINQVGQPSPN